MSLRYWLTRPTKLAWAARTAADRVYESTVSRSLPRVHAWRLRRRRGASITVDESARYAIAVADDYEAIARVARTIPPYGSLFRDRRVLELGPGDVLSVGLVALLRGAASYHAVDAYDIASREAKRNDDIYRRIAEREGAPPDAGPKAIASGRVERDLGELARRGERFDLVLSRAVLEHVSDLEALFEGLADVVTPDAVLLHKVDLRSHGMEQDSELDFLLFPPAVYQRMSSHLDLPNRVRAGAYLELAERHRLVTLHATATHLARDASLERVRGELGAPFSKLSDAELRILGLWLVQGGPERRAVVPPPRRAEDVPPLPAEGFSRY